MVLLIGMGMMFMRRGSAGDEYRAAAHRMVAGMDGYTGSADYYDYLVDAAHDEVFNDAYHMERGGGRFSRDGSWVDEEQYFDGLIRSMIRRAGEDKALVAINALTAFQQKRGAPDAEPAPPPATPRRRRLPRLTCGRSVARCASRRRSSRCG